MRGINASCFCDCLLHPLYITRQPKLLKHSRNSEQSGRIEYENSQVADLPEVTYVQSSIAPLYISSKFAVHHLIARLNPRSENL